MVRKYVPSNTLYLLSPPLPLSHFSGPIGEGGRRAKNESNGSRQMTNDQDKPSIINRGSSAPVCTELDAFLAEIRGRTTPAAGTRGRLIFALDATMSREETWDLACQLQGEMFREV